MRLARLRDGSDRLGVVRDIVWHIKKNAPLYVLWLEGKPYTRRLWHDARAPAP